MDEYLGDMGLILLILVLLCFCIPLMFGMLIACLVGAIGFDYYFIVGAIAIIIWIIFICYYMM